MRIISPIPEESRSKNIVSPLSEAPKTNALQKAVADLK